MTSSNDNSDNGAICLPVTNDNFGSIDIREALGKAIESKKNGWQGSISFNVYVVPKTCKTDDEVTSFIKENDLRTVDIC